MFGVFVAISSRSDIATQAHRSCQGLLGLFSTGPQRQNSNVDIEAEVDMNLRLK